MINNFQKVSSCLVRGSRPEDNYDFNYLKYLEVTHILNLERGYFEAFRGIMNRETIMSIESVITPIRIEMGDFLPPTLDEMIAAIRLILTSEKTFVHCAFGKDRTGMVCAFYRVVVQGWSEDQAIAEWIDLGLHNIYKPFWIPAFRKYCRMGKVF